jgi:hypothetical protein
MLTKYDACEVEFIGGPIDGHVASFHDPPAPFISATASRFGPIGRWLRRFLPSSKGAGTVAVYELHALNGQPRYRHAGSAASSPGTLPCIYVDVSGPTGGKGDET